MLKPLLKVLPSYSGNVKLFCTIGEDDYTLIENKKEYKQFEANVRFAKLLPISSNLAQNNIEVSLLNSNYEFDIQKFYNRYADYFFENCFEYNKGDYELIDKTDSQKPRNTDFEFGCKRVSYIKSGKQFAFFAPIYMESGEDVPDYFIITIRIKNSLYDVKRLIRVNIKNNNNSPYNYLYKYVTRYADKLDDNCIFCMPQSKQATYYGIDLLKGGFNRHVDSIVGKVFSKQSTINNFDAVISSGWKRTFLCMKQVLPLCFCFSLNDVFDKEEYTKYINTPIYISGAYYKDDKELPFYDFDTNYTELYENPYVLNEDTGNMYFKYTGINLMNTKYPSLNEGRYIGYRYSNKLAPMYSRWKLKYSSDEDPYITNINPVFSYNQESKYKYKTYPLQYIPGNMFCTARNSLMLPLRNSLKNKRNPYYKDKNIVERYYKIINNHAGTWFDMIYKNEDPKSTEGWVKTHDNKAYYKGILYNLGNIYNENPDIQHIDNFKVFVRLNFLKINKEDLKDIKSSEYTFYINDDNIQKQNITLSASAITNTYAPQSVISLYTNETKEIGHKHEVDYNALFMPNNEGKGQYINPLEYGIDFTTYNRYYSLTYLAFVTKQNNDKRFMKGKAFYSDQYKKYITTSYELLPVYRLHEVFDINNRILFANENQTYGNNILNKLYFSMQGNYVKIEYDTTTLRSLKADYGFDFFKVPLYIKSDFISEGKLREIIYKIFSTPEVPNDPNVNNPNDWLNTYLGQLPYYNFIPFVRYNNMEYARNVFVRGDGFNEKFYGDMPMSSSQLIEDKHFIYVDPYNLSYIMSPKYKGQSGTTSEFEINEGNSYEFYAKLLNKEHLKVYLRTAYNDATKSLTIENGLGSLYVKKRMMINNNKTNELVFKDNYIPLSNFYTQYTLETNEDYVSFSNVLMDTMQYNSTYAYWSFTPEYCTYTDIDNIAGIPDQDNYNKSQFNFELYYKKTFVKLDQKLYDIMNLELNEEVKPEYTDLYLYTLNDKSDISSYVKYYYTEDLTYIDNSISVSQSLTPLFDDVWQQHRNNTVIYKEWMQKRIWGTQCGNNTYYRFNMDNTKYMLDISGLDYIIDHRNSSKYYTYSYVVNQYDQYLTTLDDETNAVTFETYLSDFNLLPSTYDKLNNCYSYLTNYEDCDYLSTYNDYKLNTFKQDGETYGFFLIDTFFDNTYASFNIINDKYGKQKYFVYINDEDIYEEDFNIKNLFNLVLPACKVNLYNNFINSNTLLQRPTPFSFAEIYKSNELKDSYNNTYGYDIKEYGTLHTDILCERYLDSIVPYIKETGMIPSVYNKKFKSMKASVDISYTNDMIFKTDLNPYQYEPLHVFNVRNKESLFTPVEYKHFNDNKFINLKEEITIFVADNLSYNELTELEEEKYVLEKFTKYFNGLKKNTYNENEILFLFKKYKVEFDSVPTGLDTTGKYKVYTLSYKFKLL